MYVTIDYADEYFSVRFGGDEWFNLSDEDKEKALKTAQKRIDKLPFIGVLQSPNQSSSFPRVIGGKTFLVPQAVRDAVCEEALNLVEKNSSPNPPRNVKSVGLGSASITFKDAVNNGVCDAAEELLSGWLKRGCDIASLRFVEEM